MVTKLSVRDNTKTPHGYITDLPAFRNGKEYLFQPGVNIIVGQNGCGKTTLLNLLKYYLMVDRNECSRGEFNSNINRLYKRSTDGILDGIDVYADYTKNTFRLSHLSDEKGSIMPSTASDFGTMFSQMNSSTGENVLISLNALFKKMFTPQAKLTFDYKNQFEELYPEYVKYTNEHRLTDCPDEYTIMMDEPDRNLDVHNAETILNILSKRKEQTQLIATVHNPLIIYALANNNSINFIEMSPGYIGDVMTMVDKLTNK